MEAQNDEKAKSCRPDCHCRYRAVHRCRHIILFQSSKAELLYSLDCLCLYSVHRVVFSLKTGKIESLPHSSCRTSLTGFLAACLIKIKFEVDTNPPAGFGCEFRTLLLPAPCKIRIYDMSSLFAGKIHALLCRNWSRIKGRDLYDYLFYLARHAEVNMLNLKEKLADSGLISADTVLDKKYLTELLNRRFQSIDYNQAKNDVRPFLRNPDTIEIWDADFFISATHQYLSGVASTTR